ncbi:MAG TPA: GerMN domain-containing protein [Mycobacteriales bacterium]|nr:GerMN domain-containing protein [Mycobacteriales bacterium]
MLATRSSRLAALAVVVASLAGCDSGSGNADRVDASPSAAVQATPSGEPSATPTGPPSGSPSTTATASAARMTVAVYYLVDTKRGIRLQREFRQVRRSSTPVRSALDLMLREAALDRDYRSLWPKTTQVRGISRSGSTATVDLSKEALEGNAGSEATSRSVQQLVHTVTAADTSIQAVRILVAGREVSDLWGHESLAGRSIKREPHINVLAAVSIDAPSEGDEVGQTFTLSGTATVFEANVQWRVTRGCPADVTCVGEKPVYRSGFVTASEGAPGRGTWSVRVTLPDEVFDTSGYVEITAFEESAEDGSEFNSDTKVVHASR